MIIDTSKKVVPNWFGRTDMEMIINRKITRKEFKRFSEFVAKTNVGDVVSELMPDLCGVNLWRKTKND